MFIFVFCFLQIEGMTLHQQKDSCWLYCCGLEPNPQYRQGLPVILVRDKIK